MSEQKKREGHWYLPESPDDKVFGTLKLARNGFHNLTLNGAFQAQKKPERLEQFPCIVGDTRAERDVVLFECSGYAAITRTRARFTAARAFTGWGDLPYDPAPQFNEVAVSVTSLQEWAGITGFVLQKTPKSGGHRIRYDYPKPVRIYRTGDLEALLAFGPAVSTGRYAESIEQRTSLVLTSKGLLSFDQIRSILDSFQVFFGLVMGYPVSLSRVRLRRWQRPRKQQYRPELDVLAHYATRKGTMTSTQSHFLRLPLRDLGDEIETLTKAWFSTRDRLKPVTDLYLSTVSNPALYIETSFLHLAQALESFHRQFRQPRDLAQGYPEYLEKVLNHIPPDLKAWKSDVSCQEWLGWKLKHAYEPTLQVRLQELAREFFLGLGILSKKKADGFAGSVASLRNELTHPDRGAERSDDWYSRVMERTKQMRQLLELCMLAELGLSRARLKETSTWEPLLR